MISRWRNSPHWALYDENGILVAVFVYKKGAREVAKRLNISTDQKQSRKEDS